MKGAKPTWQTSMFAGIYIMGLTSKLMHVSQIRYLQTDVMFSANESEYMNVSTRSRLHGKLR